jgi:hypothetical protein
MSDARAQPFDGLYIDLITFVPVMGHLVNENKLNKRFSFFQTSSLFCEKYLLDYYNSKKKSSLFIHNVGILQTLTKYEIKNNKFWSNIVNKDLFKFIGQINMAGGYPFLPYFVKPKLKLSIDKNALSKITDLKYHRVTVEIRLYPQSVAVVHVKIYIKSILSRDAIVKVMRKFEEDRIFNLSKVSARKLGLPYGQFHNYQFIVNSIAKRIWKTLYIGEPEAIDSCTDCRRHRIIIPLRQEKLTNTELTSLLLRSLNPKDNETSACTRNKIEETKDSSDVIAFIESATILHAPKNNRRENYCLRKNYSNVIELALLQDFFVSTIKGKIDKDKIQLSFDRDQDLGTFNLSALSSTFTGFYHSRKHICGGHRKLYKQIERITKHELMERDLIMSYEDASTVEKIVKQLKQPQETLEKMLQNAVDNEFEDGLLEYHTIKSVQALGSQIMDETAASISCIAEEELKSYKNSANIAMHKSAIQKQFNVLRTTYLPQYKALVERLVADPDKVKEKVDAKRKAGETVPDEKKTDELLKEAKEKVDDTKKTKADTAEGTEKPKTFLQKAVPVLTTLGGAAVSVLKALGYWPL